MVQNSAIVVVDEKEHRFDHAVEEARALWLEAGELARRTGWELKPQGLCHGELCFPIPSGRDADFVSTRDDSTYLNFTAFADRIGIPWAGDVEHRVWYFGEDSAARGAALKTLKAPDFELPDVDGRTHRLSDHLGKKVLLVSWASW
ncbi:MAG TPA: hypothetical protein VJX23_10975 [Candidatus Binataceae bacterium]|nr:hypothetical protein [Candidatus Binataceae bacterium]